MEDLIRYNDPSKGPPKFREVEGMVTLDEMSDIFLQGLSLEEHFERIKNLKMRDDDIVLCAYAKCGTHWVWEILNFLILKKINKQSKVTRMIDATPSDKLDALPSPRILNTHYPPHLLPKEIKEKKTKIVYIYRNPKDVAVSRYFHFSKSIQIIDAQAGDLSSFIKIFPESPVSYNFFKYLKEFKDFLEKNTEIPSITLTYEDLTHHPVENVERLAKFLDLDRSEEEIKEVIEACSFDSMKKADLEFKEDFPTKSTDTGESSIFRQGKTGDWKNHFTVADSEMYDAIIAREMERTGIRFKFE